MSEWPDGYIIARPKPPRPRKILKGFDPARPWQTPYDYSRHDRCGDCGRLLSVCSCLPMELTDDRFD